uniref:Aspartyl beta-hydroxylase/Triadin domain-containing protein n=1 Tax=Graphocephala atropunctata TaxID=36148 RepID=A0A1B6M099_9HEMI
MSGDVQPRKRKDKRKKKEDEEVLQHHGSIGGSDEVIHVHKESNLGGNICSKIVFFGLLGALGVMVGLIIIEYHGTTDVDTQSASDSPWSVMLEGWVDNSVAGHDDHEPAEHEDEGHDEHDEHAEAEYSEGEHEDEAAEEDIDEVSFVKQTYEDLKAAYSQVTPEESEAEQTEEASLKSNEEGATESEPEASETEEEDEEEEVKEDDPLGQWKSDSGPELLAEEVEEVQTGSETEEESEDEEEEAPTGGPNSNEIDDGQDSQNFVNEEILEPVEHLGEPVAKVDSYENADITNEADWEIREALDEADQDLEDGNPSSALSKYSALVSTFPLSPRALHGKARALDTMAESQRSNQLLIQAITAYTSALQSSNITDTLLLRLANRTINRMRFKGLHAQAVDVHNKLIQRFPNNITYQIDLAITYLMINSVLQARDG